VGPGAPGLFLDTLHPTIPPVTDLQIFKKQPSKEDRASQSLMPLQQGEPLLALRRAPALALKRGLVLALREGRILALLTRGRGGNWGRERLQRQRSLDGVGGRHVDVQVHARQHRSSLLHRPLRIAQPHYE
jgi:hypothetical protein